jgi:carbamoyl-phosphate synthase small subunit
MSLIQKAIDSPDMAGSDYVKAVSVTEPYEWNPSFKGKYRVVAFDYGIKYNILRLLEGAGCSVVVMPATASAEDALAQNPDGIFLSNGPGDPAALPYIYPTIQGLFGKKPIFGICLGHQILGHAFGGTTYKLKFGHRGGNQPVMNHTTGQVEISAQNHGFAVDADSLDASEVTVTHTNLNDGSVEGMEHRKLPVFSVQYHPESSPGPHDSRYLFARFISMMAAAKA